MDAGWHQSLANGTQAKTCPLFIPLTGYSCAKPTPTRWPCIPEMLGTQGDKLLGPGMDHPSESQHLHPPPTLSSSTCLQISGSRDLRMPPPTAVSAFLTSLSSAKPMSCTERGFGNQTSLTRRDKDKVCKDRKASRARSQGFSDEQSCLSPETSSLAKLQRAK